MEHQTLIPKKRIDSIDALRGFAIIGIVLWHCMEHFDLSYPLVSPPPVSTDTTVFTTIQFLFAGKAYAIFSLLFGLSFFMQMDSQASRGVDFRARFVWRLFLLFVLGYINGCFYMGEFFIVYAVLGVLLVLFYNVPSRWLLILAIILFLQIPGFVIFFSQLRDNVPVSSEAYMDALYHESSIVFTEGSFWDVIRYNMVKGQMTKCLWVINNYRYMQLIGLFIIGLLIGRAGIHKDEAKMVKYSKRLLPYSVAVMAIFYPIAWWIIPATGLDGAALDTGVTLFRNFAALGHMMLYICLFMLAYYQWNAKKVLDRLSPVGKMSVTNYMAQSWLGVFLFYGFGLYLTPYCGPTWSACVGLCIALLQILYSNWWIKRFYYGPVEWLWRVCTWMRPVKFRR